MIKTDTIAAVSTAMQTAAIGIVRISGANSLNIINKLFKANSKIKAEKFLSGKLYLGEFSGEGFVDKCMCVVFKEPNSYTGENMAEIHCHGGVQVVKGILTSVLKTGARLADNGEFTRRAFINGKTDLSKAEGLIEMIEAESLGELNAASKLASGDLYTKTTKYQEKLTDIISHTEVFLDYPEEDLSVKNIAKLKSETEEILKSVQNLAKTYSTGKMLKEGINLVICGVTNAGKSTLINKLLNYDRSIVTDIGGTTTDTVEDFLEIKGVKFKIIDTAGIREGKNLIEKLGIERALKAVNAGDLILYLIDPETYESKENLLIQEKLKNKKVITILNKTDLKISKNISCDIEISAKENINIEELKNLITKTVNIKDISNQTIITTERHFNALIRTQEKLEECLSGFEKKPYDILAFELKQIWDILGEITGTCATEEIINNIFSKFCLGK